MKNKKISIWGIILILVGAVYFLKNFIDIPSININWSYIWPVLLIIWGVKLILRKGQKTEKEN